MNPAELVQVCSAGVFSCDPPAVRNRLLENSCLGFTTVGGTRENFCVGLVTSSCLIRFDAHSEQIDLSLDKIKVLKPFPPNCFNPAPYLGVLCYAELSSFLFKNIFTDWDGWDKLRTVTIETAGNFTGFLLKWAWELFWASLQVTCMSAKHVCKQAVSSCMCAQLCLTVCGPMDCSPSGSSVHGILQAEYWSGLPYPPLEGLPDSGIKPMCPALASGFSTTALVGRFFISPHQFTILIKYRSAERQEFERAESQTMEVERSRFNLNILFPFSYCVTWDRLAWYIATEKLVSGLFNLSSLFHPKERCYL